MTDTVITWRSTEDEHYEAREYQVSIGSNKACGYRKGTSRQLSGFPQTPSDTTCLARSSQSNSEHAAGCGMHDDYWCDCKTPDYEVALFDILEALKPHFPQIASSFARGGGVDLPHVLAVLGAREDGTSQRAVE